MFFLNLLILCSIFNESLTLAVICFLVGVVQREGFLGLYRANGVQMLRVFPYGAIQFASYEAIKKLLDDGRQDSRRHWRKLVAGSVGGVCGVVVTYPLDTLRAHLAFHSKVVYLRECSQGGWCSFTGIFNFLLAQTLKELSNKFVSPFFNLTLI